ncbi:hypothetical protein GO013_07305 [Pseudodesulfovibrio sp. JC047]|uniref:portal protein n=1 Tax=Pseudodesulfovibrio sp. JC047 TaxID=2683199 RepID=UPI0013D1D085|nr:portal protein [Pseudodesulfovibrio sp. JC047]NDV19225.1 hypothetical protein [Pseudodesulfovibrio sp. JC047]
MSDTRFDDLLRQYESGCKRVIQDKIDAQEAALFCKPRKANVNTGPKSRAQKKNLRKITSYAETDMDTWASGTQGTTMPRDMLWFNFTTENEESAKVREHRAWLQHVDQVVLSALIGSNMAEEIHEGLLDAGYANRCTVFMKEGRKQTLFFDTRPPFEYVFFADSDGNADTAIAKVTKTAREWDREFQGKAGAVVAEHIKDKELDTDVEFLHAVFPRTKRNPKVPGALNMPFAEVYAEISKKETVFEAGFSRFPFLAFGTVKPASGPAQKAITEILQLNSMDRTVMRGGEKRIDPPVMAQNDAVTGPIRNGASSVTFADFTSGDKPPVQAMPVGDPGIGVDLMARKQAIIDMHFCRAAFEMEEIRSGVTLGERQMRKLEKATNMEPFFSRFFNRIPTPMLLNAFDICMSKGLIRPAPESMGEDSLKVVLTGPLVRAMRYGADVEATDQMYDRAALIVERTGDQSVLDNLDNDAAMRIYEKRFNPPAELMVAEKARQEARESRAAQAEEQAAMQKATMGADMAQKMAGMQGVAGNA